MKKIEGFLNLVSLTYISQCLAELSKRLVELPVSDSILKVAFFGTLLSLAVRPPSRLVLVIVGLSLQITSIVVVGLMSLVAGSVRSKPQLFRNKRPIVLRPNVASSTYQAIARQPVRLQSEVVPKVCAKEAAALRYAAKHMMTPSVRGDLARALL